MPALLPTRLSARLTLLLLVGGLLPAALVGLLAQRLFADRVQAEAQERQRRLAERGGALVLDVTQRAEGKLRTLGRLLARELGERQVGSYGQFNAAYRETVLARINALVEPPDTFLELQYFSGGEDPQFVGLAQQTEYRDAQRPLDPDGDPGARFLLNIDAPLVQEPLFRNRATREDGLKPFGEYVTLRISTPVSESAETPITEVLGALVAHVDFRELGALLGTLLAPGESLELCDAHGTQLVSLGTRGAEADALAHTQRLEGLDWQLTVREPRARVEEPLRRLRRQGLLALGAALALSLALGLAAALRVTRPLATLRRTAEAMGRGELDARTGLVRDDEIGSLARSFDSMADELASLDEAKSEFVANVSHELRTPLTGMRLAIANLLDGVVGELDERQRATLERLRGDLDRLIALTSGLLELARLDAGAVVPAREPIELFDFAGAVIADWQARAQGAGTHLVLEGAGGRALADARLLRRVLENLLDNALKFSPPGSCVRVRVEGSELWVEDEGPGVGSVAVFERFRQGEVEGVKNPGVGLGLAIVRELVERMGGSIDVEDRPGACFRVRLEPSA